VLSFRRRRASAVLLTLALAAGQPGICAGWMATPEARIACCSDDGTCPMHTARSGDHGTTRNVTQADADRCCAASEQDDSAPSPSTIAISIALAIVHAPIGVLNAERDAHANISRRASVPIPAAHVPKHLLLSVFLV
jgi:hypothetical protein